MRVPGDKSIAHRWLILAATALGRSRLVEVPTSLDVRSTASCLAALTGEARPALDAWASNDAGRPEGHRSTWNVRVEGTTPDRPGSVLEVEGEGRVRLVEPAAPLDCGNSGTSIRLLMGVVASRPFATVLGGDDSLRSRPMERVAQPLREMGAAVSAVDGHAPVSIRGAPLHGIVLEPATPSAQVKSAVLLAGLDAEGTTTVREHVGTRDHTERALAWLGAPIRSGPDGVSVHGFQHGGFEGRVPGDPSSAAFLVGAAALTGSSITIGSVGLNPTRLGFLDVMGRMGIAVEVTVEGEQVGEPVGTIHVPPIDAIGPVRVEPDELPLVIDEVPILAMTAMHAAGDSRFAGAAELRVKESDRLQGVVDAVRAMGGGADVEGDDLVVSGGGADGGYVDARGDHRLAMAFAVAGLACRDVVVVGDMGSADVSFPGFVPTLARLGATIEVEGP